PAMLSHHRSPYWLAFLSHQMLPWPTNGPNDPFDLKSCTTENPPGPFFTTMLPLSVPPFGIQGPGSVLIVADQAPTIDIIFWISAGGFGISGAAGALSWSCAMADFSAGFLASVLVWAMQKPHMAMVRI